MILLYSHTQITPNRSQSIDVVEITAKASILVLNLEEFYGSSRLLVVEFVQNWCQLPKVFFDGAQIRGIILPHFCCSILQKPAWKPSKVPLGTDIGSWSYEHRHIIRGCKG